MICIELKNIDKYYGEGEGRQHVLKDMSLQIHRGEMVAVIGASGSGKSTLLNIAGLLDRPSSGSYELMGQDTGRMSEKERAFCRNRNIGFVFQSFHLIHELSALDNVRLSLQFYNLHEKKKVPGRIATERSREVLMSLGMEQHIHKRPMQLSGGQKQRVAIARALVNNPELILADEPTGALDVETGNQVLKLLEQIHQTGKTIVIVTHDLKVAERCSRIIKISDGKIAGI